MAIKSKTVWIAACDIDGCDSVYGEEPDWAYHFGSQAAAVDSVADSESWIRVDGSLICPSSDRVHDQARMPGVLVDFSNGLEGSS